MTKPPALKVLEASLLITLLFGLVLVCMPGLVAQGFGWMIYQNPQAMHAWPEEARSYVNLAHAVMGGVIVGWAALMLWVCRHGLAKGHPGAWAAIGMSLLAWYLPDTAASLAHGFWQNALFNTGFLLMLGTPWLLIRKHALR
ncbi:MAG TPA: hypothetical protein VFV39_08660 [Limnobacter sp.]|nr:hypothetical protein [Limnobacter sp.]